MSLSQKLAAIRQKPRRVRERYLIACMLVIAPILVVVWIITFRYDPATSGTNFFKSVGGSVSNSFSDPLYEDTFGAAAFPSGTSETP
jgi:hypothetical protein